MQRFFVRIQRKPLASDTTTDEPVIPVSKFDLPYNAFSLHFEFPLVALKQTYLCVDLPLYRS